MYDIIYSKDFCMVQKSCRTIGSPDMYVLNVRSILLE